VDSLESLSQQLLEGCRSDLEDRTRGKPASKCELLREDQAAFLPLPPQSFEARRIDNGTASSESLVRFDTNDYSVPVRYAHRQLIVVATVEEVRIIHTDRLEARHRRCWDRVSRAGSNTPAAGTLGPARVLCAASAPAGG
jgi:hypothetical protein